MEVKIANMASLLDIFYYFSMAAPLYLLVAIYFVFKKPMIGYLSLFSFVLVSNKIYFVTGEFIHVFNHIFVAVFVIDVLTYVVYWFAGAKLVKINVPKLFAVKLAYNIFIYVLFTTRVVTDVSLYVLTVVPSLTFNLFLLLASIKDTKIRFSYGSFLLFIFLSHGLINSYDTISYKLSYIFSTVSLSFFFVFLFINEKVGMDNRIENLNRRLDIVNIFIEILSIVSKKPIINKSNFDKVFTSLIEEILKIIVLSFNWISGAVYLIDKDPKDGKKKFVFKGNYGDFVPLNVTNETLLSLMREEQKKDTRKNYKFDFDEGIFGEICKINNGYKSGNVNVLFLNREKQDSIMKRLSISSYIHSITGIPLIFNEEMLGVLVLQNKKKTDYDQTVERSDYQNIGEMLVLIISNIINTVSLYTEYENTKNVRQDLEIASSLQASLLPKEIPFTKGLDIEGIMIPAKEIGGDYYDFIKIDDNKTAIMIGDISGKGLPAGMHMLVLRTIIHTIIKKVNKPKELLVYLAKGISEYLGQGKFITFLYMLWDYEEKKLYYSSCGHEHIIVHRKNERKTEKIKSGGIALGIVPDIDAHIEEKVIELEPGDVVVLYTDGITEARDGNREFFGLDNLVDKFRRYVFTQKNSSEITVKGIKDEILDSVFSFSEGNADQYDDMTLVVLKRNEE